jgi:hypothetical protein
MSDDDLELNESAELHETNLLSMKKESIYSNNY